MPAKSTKKKVTSSAKSKPSKSTKSPGKNKASLSKLAASQKIADGKDSAARGKTAARVKRSVKQKVSRVRSKFSRLWPNYLLQSILCTFCVLAVLWVLQARQLAIVASIGASSFIVFAMPKAGTAQPKSIVWGYLTGLAIGSISWLIPQPTFTYQVIVYAVVVGITMFAMIATDSEHPPACGTALGVAISG